MKQTMENLTKAFIGESQARNRYTFYASTARKEGYEQIAGIFQLTADNENEHAEWLMRMINQLKAKSADDYSEIHVEASAPTVWGTTVDNLKAAIAGETYEYTTMYPEFARTAKAEGYKDIAGRLLSIAAAEEHHAAGTPKYSGKWRRARSSRSRRKPPGYAGSAGTCTMAGSPRRSARRAIMKKRIMSC